MLLKRIDGFGNKTYVDRFTGAKVKLKYVGHRVKVKYSPSARDAYRIETMRHMVGLRKKQYQKRLAAYTANNLVSIK